MQKRHQRWIALGTASAIVFASLGSMAAIRDHGEPQAKPAKAERVAPILVPTAMDHAKANRLAREATLTELQRLDELQAQLGVYRPWGKAVE